MRDGHEGKAKGAVSLSAVAARESGKTVAPLLN